MSVPAHDERDYEFAKKYKLDIRIVIVPRDEDPEADRGRARASVRDDERDTHQFWVRYNGLSLRRRDREDVGVRRSRTASAKRRSPIA